ncbi:MAG TPA: DUF4397 domain-containing protein [Chryseosolibacter sp.]|nr:DUF4397 domain-containing protein [Chryseosolibacter sp.]
MNRIMHFFSKFRSLFFSVALLVLLASCLDDNDGYVNQPVEVAYVSIYHAVPDAPDFDIVVDNRVINVNPFDYSSYSGYLNFYTGNRNIRFNTSNAANSVVDTTFNFEDGKAYSLFAINRLSDVQVLLVVDSAAAPAEGKAMVRFVHLSPDAPAFNVSVEGDNSALFAGKAFKDATQFKEIEGGTHSFVMSDAATGETVLSAKDVEMLPGRYYTIITRGFKNPPDGNTHVLSMEVLE